MIQPRSPTIRTVMQANAENSGDQLASRAAFFIVAAFTGAQDRVSPPNDGAPRPPSTEPSHRTSGPHRPIEPIDGDSDQRARRCKPHRRDRGEV